MAARMSIAVAAALAVSTGAALDVLADTRGGMHTHIGHVMWSWNDTPAGDGLLPTAVAEASIALEHAELALADPDNIELVKNHLGHVVNAIDPTLEPDGPSLGYGLILAADGAAVHLGFALDAGAAFPLGQTHLSGGDSDNPNHGDIDAALDELFETAGEDSAVSALVLEQAGHASHSLANATDWAARALDLAQSARTSDDPAWVVEKAQSVLELMQGVVHGRDLDNDGTISVEAGEGGLDHAQAAMAMIMESEGLSAPAE